MRSWYDLGLLIGYTKRRFYLLTLYSAENNGLSCSSEYQFNMKSEWLPYYNAYEYDHTNTIENDIYQHVAGIFFSNIRR